MSFETSALLATWIVIALLAFAVAGLVRQVHLIGKAVAVDAQPGPRLGSRAPVLNGSHNLGGKPSVLLFAEAGCSSCEAVLPHFVREAEAVPESVARFVAVFTGRSPVEPSRSLSVREDAIEAHRLFDIPTIPFAVALSGSDVVLDAAPVGSPKQLEAFVRSARRRWANGSEA
ncbi:MAG: hypothetical protein WD770_11095 [Actinomycetota bacterium]